LRREHPSFYEESKPVPEPVLENEAEMEMIVKRSP
jgi:hypothetical protein